jgi:outer membrane protein OmpA-like peptidoglycan-associated protein
MNPADFYDGMAPAVYFEIGKAVLSPVELKHLEFIAEQLIAKADDSTKITITVMGTADSNTGTTKRNVYLSEARGRYVFDILVDKYGIDEDSLVLTSEIIDAEDNPQFDRAVKITF